MFPGIEASERAVENDSAKKVDQQVNPQDKNLAEKTRVEQLFVCEICEKSFSRKDCLAQVIAFSHHLFKNYVASKEGRIPAKLCSQHVITDNNGCLHFRKS